MAGLVDQAGHKLLSTDSSWLRIVAGNIWYIGVCSCIILISASTADSS